MPLPNFVCLALLKDELPCRVSFTEPPPFALTFFPHRPVISVWLSTIEKESKRKMHLIKISTFFISSTCILKSLLMRKIFIDDLWKLRFLSALTMQTNYGDIEFGFYPNVAPKTVEHIFKLVRLGGYNTNHFFRVIICFYGNTSFPRDNGCDFAYCCRWIRDLWPKWQMLQEEEMLPWMKCKGRKLKKLLLVNSVMSSM